MKYFLFGLLLSIQQLAAQELTKQDAATIKELKKTISYLADDKLEGRRTGTAGEKLAYEFIEKEFTKIGLAPLKGNSGLLQTFDVNEGKELTDKNFLTIGDKKMILNEDYFPMVYSLAGPSDQAKENKSAGVFIYELENSNKGNPHFDLHDAITEKVKEAANNGASVVFIYDTSAINEKFDGKDKSPALSVPVFYLTESGTKKYLSVKNNPQLSYNIDIIQKISSGHNVAGYIDNHALNTIILGAHYDHLGYGQDHTSLYVGIKPMIHNGADDNASGVAALIDLAKWLKSSGLKKYNYVFIAFSGEELGLYGSKYFTEHSPLDLKTIDYMLNMDMVGRLNDSTHSLTIGGYGTSPSWSEIINTKDGFFKIKADSSGNGPSDHTSFYLKDIPVLFFFTGSHSDYHKPTDDVEKINFKGELAVINYIKKVLTATDQKEKLIFTKTRDTSPGRSSFRVTLGIMPDYTFDGSGVRVDAVSENRPAQKAGIKAGDVLYQLGDHPFNDMETYMQTLNKFNKGDATKVKLKRGQDDIILNVIF